MTVKDGRFGPYVTDGTTNASLQRGDTPETMTDARANELLSARRAREAQDAEAGGTSGTGRAKKTAKKAKKTTKRTAKKAAKKTAKKTTKKPPQTTKRVIKAGSRRK